MRLSPAQALLRALLVLAMWMDVACATWLALQEPLTMQTPRYGHSAVVLSDGVTLLVAGGTDGQRVLDLAEVLVPPPSPSTSTSASASSSSSSNGQWHVTSSMNQPRMGHTLTVLPNGWVLVTGGCTDLDDCDGTTTATTELYDPSEGHPPLPGTFYLSTSMTLARAYHTATLLADRGIVVVTGGWPLNADTSTEALDIATGVWQALPLATMDLPRDHHTAILLPNGLLSIWGGSQFNDGGEILNVTTSTWTRTASAPGSVVQYPYTSATLLLDGSSVLVAGTSYVSASSPLRDTAIYNITSDTWTEPPGHMITPRYRHTATLLANGLVLVVGGIDVHSDNNGDQVALCSELFDPSTGTWASSSGCLAYPRLDHTTSVYPNDVKVVAVGGQDPQAAANAETYDYTNAAWADNNNAPFPDGSERVWLTVTLLPLTGKILLVGGVPETDGPIAPAYSSTLLYDEETGYSAGGSLVSGGRAGHTASLVLSDAYLLVAGGFSSTVMAALATCELYDVAQGTWSPVAPMSTARSFHRAVVLLSGQVLVAGGMDSSSTPIVSTELYDPSAGQWTTLSSLNEPRVLHSLTLLADGSVLAAGGAAGSDDATAEVYDPSASATPTWAYTAGPMTSPRTVHSATLLHDGRVLIAGGMYINTTVEVSYRSAEIYDPVSGLFAPTASMSDARCTHGALVMAGGGGNYVLVVGGADVEQFSLTLHDSSEVYLVEEGGWILYGSMSLPRMFLQGAIALTPSGAVFVAGGAVPWYPGSSQWQVINTTDVFACRPGYFGGLCAAFADPATTCKNGGVLRDNFGGNGLCACPAGYTDDYCAVPDCRLVGCAGNGTCDPVVGGACSCVIGWTADFCTVPQPCTAELCQHDGVCVPGDNACVCTPGYGGVFCQDQLGCFNETDPQAVCIHGTCVIGGEGVYCVCPFGYQGDQCQELSALYAIFPLLPVIIGMTLAVVLFALGKYRYSPDADNRVVFVVLVGVVDLITHIVFLLTAYNEAQVPRTLFGMAMLFVILPMLANLGFAMWFLLQMSRDDGDPHWFAQHHTVVAIVATVAMTNAESVSLLRSRLYNLDMFSAEWPDWALDRIEYFGVVPVFLQDIPQIVIQSLITSRTNDFNSAALASIFMASVSITKEVVSRVFLSRARSIQSDMYGLGGKQQYAMLD